MSKLLKLKEHLSTVDNNVDIDISNKIILNDTLNSILDQAEDYIFVGGLVEIKLVSHIDNLINELNKYVKVLKKKIMKDTLKILV